MEPTVATQSVPGALESPARSTMLALVQSLLDKTGSEASTVRSAAGLVNSGRVVLTGNFAGCRIEAC